MSDASELSSNHYRDKYKYLRSQLNSLVEEGKLYRHQLRDHQKQLVKLRADRGRLLELIVAHDPSQAAAAASSSDSESEPHCSDLTDRVDCSVEKRHNKKRRSTQPPISDHRPPVAAVSDDFSRQQVERELESRTFSPAVMPPSSAPLQVPSQLFSEEEDS